MSHDGKTPAGLEREAVAWVLNGLDCGREQVELRVRDVVRHLLGRCDEHMTTSPRDLLKESEADKHSCRVLWDELAEFVAAWHEGRPLADEDFKRAARVLAEHAQP